MSALTSRLVSVLIAAVFTGAFTSCQQAVPTIDDDHAPNTVTIICESPGYSSEETEEMVASTLEMALNGLPDIRRVTSVSRAEQVVVWVEFYRETDIFHGRQIVAERLKIAALPDGVELALAPVASGEIMLIALRDLTVAESPAKHIERAVQLRHFAEMTLLQRLLALPGVSEVTVAGGLRKQYQVTPSPEKLVAFDVTARELVKALRQANTIPGDLPLKSEREVIVRSIGHLRTVQDIGDTVVKVGSNSVPLRVKDMADVRVGWVSEFENQGGEVDRRENADIKSAVILAVRFQPGAEPLAVSEKIDEVLEQSRKKLLNGVKMQRKVDQQLDRLVRKMVNKFQRTMPPDVQLQRRSSERLGDVLAISSTRRIVVKLSGPELSVLRDKAAEIHARVKQVPGVVNPQINPQGDVSELRVQLDRDKAKRLGVTTTQVAEAISIASAVYVVSKIHEGDKIYDLVIKNNEEDGKQFANTRIRTISGQLVTVGHVAKVTRTQTPRAIYHMNGQRMVFVSCNLKGRDLADVKSDIRQAISAIVTNLDVAYAIAIGE